MSTTSRQRDDPGRWRAADRVREPDPVDDTQPGFAELASANFDAAAVAKSRRLAQEVRRVAQTRGVQFADAATVARAGGDGIHLSLDSHQRLAGLLAPLVAPDGWRGLVVGAPMVGP